MTDPSDPPHSHPPADVRAAALEALLVEKQLVGTDTVDAVVEELENRGIDAGPVRDLIRSFVG
jgi:hypothetical protein